MARLTTLTLTLLLLGSCALLALPAHADEIDADYASAFTIDADELADMEEGAAMSTADLYEDEGVTREEFAAMLQALVHDMAATRREKAAIVWDANGNASINANAQLN